MSVDFIEMGDRFLDDLRELCGEELTYRKLKEISDILDKIDIDGIVKNIREDRENID